MVQGLLSYYVQKNDYENVKKVCIKHGAQNLDLWIQALTYFRDLEDVEKCEKYLKDSLEIIGQENLISPLMVL